MPTFRRRSAFQRVIASLTILVLLAPLVPRTALATDPTGQPGISDTALGVPETGAAVSNGGANLASVNPSTGVATSTIAFELPKARGRSQPSLALSYASNAGAGNGGWGWSLTLPSIERTPLAGPPTYADSKSGTFDPNTADLFSFNGNPLVPICIVGTAPCTESGISVPDPAATDKPYAESFPSQVTPGWVYFRLQAGASDGRFFWSPNHQTWLVQYKSGETLELGMSLDPNDPATVASETDGETDMGAVGPVYRWHLVRQYDSERTNGVPVNRVLYSWSHAPDKDATAYLTDVYYTLAVKAATTFPVDFHNFAHHVHLVWDSSQEAPPAIPLSVFQPPVRRLRPHSVLSRVDVSSVYDDNADTQVFTRRLVRRYWLNHQPDPADYSTSNRVLLQSVQVEGRCSSNPATGVDFEGADFTISPTSGCPTLPPTTYGYSEPYKSYLPTPLANAPSALPGTFVFDFNSDGVPDVQTEDPSVVMPVSKVSLLGTQSADTFQPPLVVTYVLPAGVTTAPGTYPQGLFSPFSNGSPSPARTPGNWLGDGKMNVLFPGSYINDAGLFQFSAFTPQIGNGAISMIDVTNPTLQFWQADRFQEGGNGDGADIIYAENILGILDVDGDGYEDAITDTQIANNTTYPWPYIHLLSLRTTTRTLTGAVMPFSQTAPNALPVTSIPSYGRSQSQQQLYPTQPLTTGGSYVALLQTDWDDGINGDVGHLFADTTATWAPKWPDFKSPLAFYADINGDGLTDWVVSDPTGTSLYPSGNTPAGQGTIWYALGHGDGTFGICKDLQGMCSGADRFRGLSSFGSVPTVAQGSKFLVGDVSGDGLPDLLVVTTTNMVLYLNQHGAQFDGGHLIRTAPPSPFAQISFGDMNGSGVDDIIVLEKDSAYYVDVESGSRPGLLTTISNGYGAITTLTYQSTHELDLAATAAGNAWTSHSPQILHHVTSIESDNGLKGTAFYQDRVTTYGYANPVYDGRDRQFVGFGTVTVTQQGDVNEASKVTETTFLAGIDRPGTADRPYLSVRGKPVTVDTYDLTGHHLSTVHDVYQVRDALVGMDGRKARFAYPSEVDTYLYDAAVPSSGTMFPSSPAVVFDDGNRAIASPYKLYASSAAGFKKVMRTQTIDSYGNQTDLTDYGVSGQDPTLSQSQHWYFPAGDPTQWQWRKQRWMRNSAPNASGDLPLVVAYTYYPDGQLWTTSTTAAGEVLLSRAHTESLPATATVNGATITTKKTYDSFGQPDTETGPLGECSRARFDIRFDQLPLTQIAYHDACGSGSFVVTSQSWDRGLERVTLSIAANGAHTVYGYDGFGRNTTINLPDPTTGVAMLSPTVTISYPNAATNSSDGIPVVQTLVSATDATLPGAPTQQTWHYADPFGHPLFTLSQADPSAGDGGSWVVSGVTTRTSRGAPQSSYAPFFSTTTAAGMGNTFPVRLATSFSAHNSTKYDAFGRVSIAVGIDGGTPTSSHKYHALEHDVQDGQQMLTSAGSYTKFYYDGHGRVQKVARGTHTALGAADEIDITTTYSAAGNPLVVTQSHSLDAATVTRTMIYNSRGQVVSNVEPNTSSNGVGWRYAYDLSGNLVGTSDARGCGENIAYDNLGRRLLEDYAPCTAAGQDPYTAAPAQPTTVTPSTATGVEVLYQYDTDEAPGSTILHNRITGVFDRGAATSYGYDARGRVTSVSRQLAAPAWTSTTAIGTPGNYDTVIYRKIFQFDGLNRPIGETSGAEVAALLNPTTGTALVTGAYSLRGVLTSVGGDYGAIVRSNIVDADGAPLTSVLGDASATTIFNCYDSMRRLKEFGASRNVALPTCAHAPLSTPASTAQPEQTVLIDDVVTGTDVVGNPLGVSDNRNASEWGPGYLPVNRGYSYDDSNRITHATYSYVTGTGGNDTAQPSMPPATAVQTPLLPVSSPGTRVTKQNYSYDWLANMDTSSDDQNAFYERSLGQIANGTGGAGPNQLTGATQGGQSLSATYDTAGNVTALNMTLGSPCTSNCTRTFSYAWDELGQLASASRWDNGPGTLIHFLPSARVSYRYDSGGQRVLREADNETNGTVYNAEIFSSLRLEGVAWQGTSYQHDAGTEVAYLTFGGASYGRVYAMARGVRFVRWFQQVSLDIGDSLGSTAVVIDQATGTLEERTTFYPYGGVESDYRSAFSTGSDYWEPYKFTGKETDNEIGLVYFGARYYSPQLGRWMSADPAWIHGLQADQNPYAYVHGRVTTATDPFGLMEAFEGTGDEGETFSGTRGDDKDNTVTFAGSTITPSHTSGGTPNGDDDLDKVGPSSAAAALKPYVGPSLTNSFSPPPSPVSVPLTPKEERNVQWNAAFERALNHLNDERRADYEGYLRQRQAMRDAYNSPPFAGVSIPTVPTMGAPIIPRLVAGSLPAAEEASLLNTLYHIDNGTIPTGPTATRWGIPFFNREGQLPGARGAGPSPYTEYRVDPGPGVSGGVARRIVVDNVSGDMFYSWTHYGQSGDPAFLQIR